jgi:ankyrin repeat protein
MDGHALIEAAKAGDAAAVERLLLGDPSLALHVEPSGETATMAALYRGHRKLAEDLADAVGEAGGSLDAFAASALDRIEALEVALGTAGAATGHAYDGWTPLHLAAFFGSRRSVGCLLDAGAAISAVSRNALANTPLHAAVAGGHADVALLLISRGADVNAADAGGHTAMHIAAEGGHVTVVQALLERGADPHAVDKEDKTPLSRAAARNHNAVIDLINLAR